MTPLIENGRPGDFRAVCRRKHWVPLHELLALPREEQPDTTTTRWDRKLACEVAEVRCAFDTTDRAVFEQHMRAVHNQKPSGPRQLKQGTGNWRPPRLFEDGQPFRASSKAIAESLRTCSRCGLVAEIVRGAPAHELWWAEHERGCALATADRAAS
jgi:hypothetical protein